MCCVLPVGSASGVAFDTHLMVFSRLTMQIVVATVVAAAAAELR